jgi:hypothetical protein
LILKVVDAGKGSCLVLEARGGDGADSTLTSSKAFFAKVAKRVNNKE